MKIDALADPQDLWRRQNEREQGDATIQKLHMEIGCLSTTWEGVEDDFSHLFQVLVETVSPAARRAYGSMMSGHARREAMREASTIFFERHPSTDNKKRFGRLIEHLKEASKRRDDVVHGVSAQFVFPDGDRGHFIVPPNYNSNFTHAITKTGPPYWRHLRAEYRYSSEDLITLAANFRVLRDALNEYVTHLTTQYGLPGSPKAWQSE